VALSWLLAGGPEGVVTVNYFSLWLVGRRSKRYSPKCVEGKFSEVQVRE